MDDTFREEEQLYRAVYPPERQEMFWKKDGSISDAALRDKKGLSVERGYYRQDTQVLSEMARFFIGTVISLTVADCREENALVLYKPTKRSMFHTEIHGSENTSILSGHQRKELIKKARVVGILTA